MKRIIFLLLLVISLVSFSGSALTEEAGNVLDLDTVAPEEREEESSGMTLWHLIKAGGLAMLAIGLCSVAAVAIVLERLINTRTRKLIPKDLIEEVKSLVKEKKYDEALGLCEKKPYFIARIFRKALEGLDRGRKTIVQAVEEAGAKEAAVMHQRIGFLSVIAVVSPMIGLLGTVIGMIQAFNVIAFQGGAGRPTLLAAGISKALVTTAFGLIVAIPTMIFFHYFRINIQKLMAKVENIMEEFIDIISPADPERTE